MKEELVRCVGGVRRGGGNVCRGGRGTGVEEGGSSRECSQQCSPKSGVVAKLQICEHSPEH